MNKIRYLSMAVMALMGLAAHGQDDFNPASPSEPAAPDVYSALVLLTNVGSDGGSVSGGGKHLVNTPVRVYATANSGYTFRGWTDTQGNVLSTATSFYFTNTEASDTLIANYEFTPGAPSEPVEPSTILYYKLTVLGRTGSNGVSGGGSYQAGCSVGISASTESGYAFLNWTDKDGTVLSTSPSFTYTTQTKKDTLYANYVFAPASPTEPVQPTPRHHVSVDATEGGYWYGTSGLIYEGNSFTLTANVNDGYSFAGWFLNGQLYTSLPNFSYTLGTEDVDFQARFYFNPASPSEPNMPALDKYSFYLMTVNSVPGRTIDYPLYLASTDGLLDMTFQLTFPTALMPDLTDIVLDEVASGYETSLTSLNDSVCVISLVGGTTPASTVPLLTFHVNVADTAQTGVSYQVKINQISVTQPDGTTVTTRTRNGRMGVYKRGDANGDDAVNILDVVSTLTLMKGVEDETLIKEAANTNEDADTNILDVIGILEIMKSNNEENNE
ncbi:MAG: dockerin [Bacteroidaceae bacterium]|nr:dockerin [Bacteroidaceae bacterium]MBQ9642356.1 dockerin [Bacteroidaceae bacterium]